MKGGAPSLVSVSSRSYVKFLPEEMSQNDWIAEDLVESSKHGDQRVRIVVVHIVEHRRTFGTTSWRDVSLMNLTSQSLNLMTIISHQPMPGVRAALGVS